MTDDLEGWAADARAAEAMFMRIASGDAARACRPSSARRGPQPRRRPWRRLGGCP